MDQNDIHKIFQENSTIDSIIEKILQKNRQHNIITELSNICHEPIIVDVSENYVKIISFNSKNLPKDTILKTLEDYKYFVSEVISERSEIYHSSCLSFKLKKWVKKT